MNKHLYAFIALLAFAVCAAAQTSGSVTTYSASTVETDAAGIETATRVAAELQTSIRADKASVGDEVLARVTRSVNQNGSIVIERGSRLIGRVTEVSPRTSASKGSSVTVLFHSVQKDGVTTPINATILGIARATPRASVDDAPPDDAWITASTRSSAQASPGLLGGVANTVRGVTNTAASAVRGVSDAAVTTSGSVIGQTAVTAGSLGTNIPGLEISRSTSASAESSGQLSLESGNVRLDRGTTLVLDVSGSTRVGN